MKNLELTKIYILNKENFVRKSQKHDSSIKNEDFKLQKIKIDTVLMLIGVGLKCFGVILAGLEGTLMQKRSRISKKLSWSEIEPTLIKKVAFS